MFTLIKAGVFDSSLGLSNFEITPKRQLTRFELEMIISGEGANYINGIEYPHKKGNIIFARYGDIRCSKNKFLCYYLHLDMESKTENLLKSIPTFTNAIDYSVLEECFTEIIKIYEDGEKRQLLIQSKIFELFDLISEQNNTNERINNIKSGITPETIRDAVDYINENYSENITLKSIAEHANFSPIYFHKMFTAYMGMTPHAYLSKKRLETAKLMLLTTELSMSEIVEKCGFSSNSYFDFHFKKEFGITPSDFRKRKYTF